MAEEKFELDPFQREIVERFKKEYDELGRRFWVFGDGVGTGKSVMTAKAAEHVAMRQEAMGNRCVVWLFTQKSAAIQQWAKIMKSDSRVNPASPLDVIILDGKTAERDALFVLIQNVPNVKWVVMNYAHFVHHGKELMETVGPNDVVIFDECDKVHNEDSSVFQLMVAIALQCHARFPASATLISNKIDSLFPMLLLASPDRSMLEHRPATVVLGGDTLYVPTCRYANAPELGVDWGCLADFTRKFGAFDDNGRLTGVARPVVLREMLERYGVSMTDTITTLGLTVERPKIINHDLFPTERDLYERIKKGIDDWIDTKEYDYRRSYGLDRVRLKMKLIQQINWAKMCCAFPAAITKKHMLMAKARQLASESADPTILSTIDFDEVLDTLTPSAKMLECLKIATDFDPNVDGGIIFYSEFTEVGDELAKLFTAHGLDDTVGVGVINAKYSQKHNEAVTFEVEHGRIKLLCVSDAGGRSLDFPQLNRTVVVNPPWTAMQVEQVVGRTTRRGQNQVIRTGYLATRDTIETKHLIGLLGQKGKTVHMVKSAKRGGKVQTDYIGELASLYEVRDWL